MPNPLAVVSGATGGIGRAVVARLWTAGYTLLCLGRTPTKCAALSCWFEARPRHGQCAYIVTKDLTEPPAPGTESIFCVQEHSMAWLHTTVERLLTTHAGAVTLLVVCHGAEPCVQPSLTLPLADVERVWRTDVLTTLALCQQVGRVMIEQRRGSICLLSSVHAMASYPARTAYALSKASICALARSLALEWGPYNVQINSICPWQVTGERTEMFLRQAAAAGEDLEELYKQRAPLRKLITPEEIAETVVWLTNVPSVSGQAIVLDAGVSASMWYKPFLSDESYA